MTTVLKSKTTKAITAIIKIKGDVAADDDNIQNLASHTDNKTDLRTAEGLIVASIRSYKTVLERLRVIEDEWMSYIAKLPKEEKLEVEEIFVSIAEKEDGLFQQREDLESSLEISEANRRDVQQAVLNLQSNGKTHITLNAAPSAALSIATAAHTGAIAAPHGAPAAPIGALAAHSAAPPAATAAPTAAPSAAPSAASTASTVAPTAAHVAQVLPTHPVYTDPSAGFQINLPQMKLVVFTGNPRDWPRFWNTFHACVDSRAVPDIVKLNYLISCLTDSAAEAVKGYDVCSDNYALVKNTLLDRFGNEEKIVEQLYRELHSLRAPGESRTEARKFVDDLEAILHQLERRNINTNDVPTMMSVEKILPKWMKPYIFTMKMTDPHLSLTKLRIAMKTMVQIAIDDRDDRGETTRCTTMAAVTPPSYKKSSTNDRRSYKSKQPGDISIARTEDKKAQRCVLCSKHLRSAECRTYDTLEKRKERIQELKLCFRCNTTGHRSKDCRVKLDKCRCGKFHNAVLCYPRNEENTATVAIATNKPEEMQQIVAHVAGNKEVALMTVEVILENPDNGHKVKTLAFFDCGAQMSFLTNELAEALKLPTKAKEYMEVKTFNGPSRRIQYSNQTVKLCENDGNKKTLEVRSIDSIVQSLQSIRINTKSADNKILNHRTTISETRTPHIIIGNDYYWSIVKGKIDQLENGFEVIDSTVGPMLAGTRSATNGHSNSFAVLTPIVTPAIADNQMDEIIKESFELDAIGITDSPDVKDDEVAWELFEKSLKFEDGRYVCSLPWKEANPKLPTNEGLAFSQLQACKSRFAKRPDLIEALRQIVEEWKEKQIIEKVLDEERDTSEGLIHYLPYHIVETPNKTSTKKRLVHNASAKIKGQSSLNELLFRGPVILPDMAAMILRFREYKEVVMGDLEKAFLQLTMNPKDRDALRFLYPLDWQKPFDKQNVEVYRFRRVNFGVISSPFLLAGAIRIHLKKYDTPLDKEMLNNTYVDNVLLEASDFVESDQKAIAAQARFAEATMNLRDFISSDKEFNRKWCPEVPNEMSFLGLKWSPNEDTVKITIPQLMINKPTKRKILQLTAGVFDPLGLVAPSLLPLRVLIQDLWKAKKGWDEPLDSSQINMLEKITEQDPGSTINLSRRIVNNKNNQNLHIFVDASKKAFAACAYLKDTEDTKQPQLIFAKIRLAPIKEVSMPRLELLALEIGTRLEKFVKQHTSATITSTTIWSDSQCVLSWIKSKKEGQPRFVANRVKKIECSTATFNYIGTKSNPADVASRGCTSEELKNDNLWWHGPEWLALTPDHWPEQPTHLFTLDTNAAENDFEMSTNISAIVMAPEPKPEYMTVNPTRFSSWNRMVRTTTQVIKFGQLLRKKTSGKAVNEDEARLMKIAERVLIREAQARHPPSAEHISQLRLYVDKDNIWRSQGRIDNSNVDFNMKNPVFLSKKDATTKLLVMHYHVRNQHSSATHTLAQLRMSFWIPQSRNFVKNVLKECCMKCRRDFAKPYKAPIMPPLPSVRVTQAPPFERTGVDYAGPFNVRQTPTTIIKTWICLFTCLVTRAVHLELVTDLTSASFLTSLRRFVARRGRPNFFLSDNGTNFRGAFSTITEGWTEQCDIEVTTYCSSERMQWKFIPSLSPWFGGVYERMIGIMKRSLSRTVGNRLLSYDQFWTLVTETEAIVNSRPLVYVSEEHRTLRPIDFIMPNAAIGMSTTDEDSDVEYKENNTTHDLLTNQWNLSKKILDALWNTWNTEYLSSLRERFKVELKQGRSTTAQSPEIGEVVIVGDEAQKRGQWKLATIEKLSESREGSVRSAFVRASNGRLLHRSIAHLYPLEIRPITQPTTEIEKDSRDAAQEDTAHVSASEKISGSSIDSEMTVPENTHNLPDSRYNLRQRTSRPSYVFYMLTILAFCGTAQAGTCPKEVPLTRVYQQECVNSGMVIYQLNSTDDYCWEHITCKNQHLKSLDDPNFTEGSCGPKCNCPQGASGCSFYTDLRNISKQDLNTRLNSVRPSVCSFIRTKECPTAVNQPVYQVLLEDGSRRYVSQLNIARTQAEEDSRVQCFGQGEIKGTPEYCAHNPCNKNGTQYCVYPHHEFAYLVTPLGKVPIKAWYSENQTVFEHPILKNISRSALCNAATVNIACGTNGVDILLGSCIPDAIEVCLNSSTPARCKFFNYVSSSVSINLPSDRLVADYSVNVKLWDNGILQHNTGISCVRKDVCEVSNCFICWSIYFHPHCILHHVGQAIWQSLLLMAAVSSVTIMLIWKFCHHRLPSRQRMFRQRRRWLPTRIQMLAVLVAIVMPTSSACSNVISFQANDSSCLAKPHGEMTCSYNQVTSVTLTSDAEACIMLKDSDNRPMGTLHLTAQHRMICKQKNVFFTTPINIKTASSKRCPGMGSCTGQTCSLLKHLDHVSELDIFESYAGKNFCEESCSCFSCGCFSCAAACMFYRIYAVPINTDIYTTFQCDWINEIEVIASLHTSTGVRQEHFKLPPGGSSKGESLTIGVQSVSRLYEFDHRARFLQFKNSIASLSKFGRKASEVFQCASAKIDNQTCFIKEDSCHCRQADSGVTCTCSDNLLLQKELTENALPQFMMGSALENMNNQVQTTVDATITLIVKAEDLIGQTKVELSSCRMEKVDLQGCFACDEGAHIDYLCLTDFGKQLAHVQCESFEFTALCNPNGELRRTTTTINTQTIKETCNISCPGSTKKFNVRGELYFISALSEWTIKDRTIVEGRPILKKMQDWLHETTQSLENLLLTVIILFVFLKLAKIVFKKIIGFLF